MITRSTAFEIATNDDVEVSAGGPNDDGKFMAWIRRGEKHKFKPLLSSKPIYGSKEEAIKDMEEIKKKIISFVKKECES